MLYSRDTQCQMERERKKAEMQVVLQNLNKASASKRHKNDVTPGVNQGTGLIFHSKVNSRNLPKIQAQTSDPSLREYNNRVFNNRTLESHKNLANSVERMQKYDLHNKHSLEDDDGKPIILQL